MILSDIRKIAKIGNQAKLYLATKKDGGCAQRRS